MIGWLTLVLTATPLTTCIPGSKPGIAGLGGSIRGMTGTAGRCSNAAAGTPVTRTDEPCCCTAMGSPWTRSARRPVTSLLGVTDDGVEVVSGVSAVRLKPKFASEGVRLVGAATAPGSERGVEGEALLIDATEGGQDSGRLGATREVHERDVDGWKEGSVYVGGGGEGWEMPECGRPAADPLAAAARERLRALYWLVLSSVRIIRVNRESRGAEEEAGREKDSPVLAAQFGQRDLDVLRQVLELCDLPFGRQHLRRRPAPAVNSSLDGLHRLLRPAHA